MNHEKVVVELELDDILPNRFQPRFKFNEQAITELAESIKEHGVIQPILVRRLGEKFEIIAGERRYKASLLAGKRTIPAIVAELNDKDSAEVALIENVQRQDLTPIEEAVSYRKILDMGYLTQEQLAEKLGKTQSTISNKLRLLNLDDDVQEALLSERISERHARSLLKLVDSKQKQKQILERIINERLTVKKTDELIEKVILGQEALSDNVPNIFMNNSVQVEEPAIQSSSAIEFINNNDTVVNSFSNNDTKDNDLLDFLNIDNNVPEIKTVPVEEVDDIPVIQPINVNGFSASTDTMTDTILEEKNEFQFEMPNSPIIEEVEESFAPQSSVINNEQELKEIDEMIKNMPSQINPGFVDVDNIEQNAQDIYVERPLADIDNLLMTSNPDAALNSPSFEQNDYNLEYQEQPISQNKFFTMVTPEDSEEIIEENVESKEETFNFTPQIESDQSLNQFLNSNIEVQTEENKENFTENKVEENYNFFDENNQFSFSNINAATDTSTIDIPVTVTSNLNVEEFYDSQDNIEEIDDAPKVINYPADNILAESVRKEEVVEMQNPTNNSEEVVDLKTVINTIRNCADTIEKYGFNLECEEYDFEDMYQVIFKIQKND